MTSAATDLATIGGPSAAHTAAAADLALIPATADEVSAASRTCSPGTSRTTRALAGRRRVSPPGRARLTAGGALCQHRGRHRVVSAAVRGCPGSSPRRDLLYPTGYHPLVSAIAWFISDAIAKLPSISETSVALLWDPTFALEYSLPNHRRVVLWSSLPAGSAVVSETGALVSFKDDLLWRRRSAMSRSGSRD